jgi:hypothetical protein
MRRSALAVVLAVAVLSGSAGAAEHTPTLRALARSLVWLKAHPPDPARDPLGFLCLDAWTWVLFSAWHPDARVRAHAAARADARLRALAPPPTWTAVSLSYWALALRLMDLRGIAMAPWLRPLRGVDLDAALTATSPTTAWWTRTLLQQVGIDAKPDPARTFIATHAVADAPTYAPQALDAYALFHEIAPATALGHAPLMGLSERQVAFAREVIGTVVAAAQAVDETDATAEALVTAALVDRRADPAYRAGVAWLLRQQHPDGTYQTQMPPRPLGAHDYRHVVLVASFALLTARDRFEPAATDP